MKTRDFLFDNYRAFLIVLVVLGHFIEPSYTETAYLTNLKYFIFAFHMPAFIFISGYFAVKKSSPGKLIQKLLVPYLIFEVIYYFTYENIIHKETELDLLYPKFSLWFLLAIFCYKLVIHYAVRIPYHLPFAGGGYIDIGHVRHRGKDSLYKSKAAADAEYADSKDETQKYFKKAKGKPVAPFF